MPGLPIYSTATTYVRSQLTFEVGSASDIVSVGVYLDTDPSIVPAVADFTAAQLIVPGQPLADGTKTDILVKIGPRGGDFTLTAGDWQFWTLVVTADEDGIQRPGVLTVT